MSSITKITDKIVNSFYDPFDLAPDVGISYEKIEQAAPTSPHITPRSANQRSGQPPLPTPEGEAARTARRTSIREQSARRGRRSTIRTPVNTALNDTLG